MEVSVGRGLCGYGEASWTHRVGQGKPGGDKAEWAWSRHLWGLFWDLGGHLGMESRGGQRGLPRPQWDITGKREAPAVPRQNRDPNWSWVEMSRPSGDLDTLWRPPWETVSHLRCCPASRVRRWIWTGIKVHVTGSPSGGNGETSDLQKGLQCTVVCEPTRCRRSKHLYHALYLPTSPVFFFFFSKKQVFLLANPYQSQYMFWTRQGCKCSHINHNKKSKELQPSPSECIRNVMSESSESPRGLGTEAGDRMGRETH